jgi:hypothetical protein
MPKRAQDVCLSVYTGSDLLAVSMTRLTQIGPFAMGSFAPQLTDKRTSNARALNVSTRIGKQFGNTNIRHCRRFVADLRAIFFLKAIKADHTSSGLNRASIFLSETA